MKMKPKLWRRKKILWALAGLAVVLAVCGLNYNFYRQTANYAQAGYGENIYGWAYNDSIGWISFNSLNCDQDNNGYVDAGNCGGDNATAPIVNYGVNVDSAGNFSGYAWNDNAGWIWMAPTSTPPGEAAPNPTHLNSDGTVSGWARICSQANDPSACTGDNGLGWLKMSGSSYGVTYDESSSEFHNFAYNDTYGWFSFNCAEGGNPPGNNICAASNYQVKKCAVNPNSSLTGWAWSPNIGWISFDCANTCSCQSANYGVNVGVGGASGLLSGYAWSSNVGWLSFSESGPPPDNYAFNSHCDPGVTCDSANNCTACFSHTDNKLYGWAKALSLGDNGWIRLDDDNASDANNYGVSLADDGEQLQGWAWGGDPVSDAGIGWLSFNCSNYRSCDGGANNGQICAGAADCPGGACVDTCSISNYKVTTKISQETLIASANLNLSAPCRRIDLTWNDVDGETAYQVYRGAASGFTPAAPPVSGDLASNVTNYTDGGLSPGTTYYYIVRAVGGIGYVDSNEVSATTDPICQVEPRTDIDSVVGQCPNRVRVRWQTPASSCTISAYQVARCQCLSNTDCSNCSVTDLTGDDPDGAGAFAVITTGDCASSTSAECVDKIDDSLREETFKYSVRAYCSDIGEYGYWSSAFDDDGVIPCPHRPSWIEHKAE